MIPHQNHHLKVAVVKKAFSEYDLKMSRAQKIISNFKAWNIVCLKLVAQITPFLWGISNHPGHDFQNPGCTQKKGRELEGLFSLQRGFQTFNSKAI